MKREREIVCFSQRIRFFGQRDQRFQNLFDSKRAGIVLVLRGTFRNIDHSLVLEQSFNICPVIASKFVFKPELCHETRAKIDFLPSRPQIQSCLIEADKNRRHEELSHFTAT